MAGISAARPSNSRSEVSVETFRAPLFERILQAEESDVRRVVLDLGAPCQHLMERLAAIRPTCFEIADLVAGGDLRKMQQIGPADETERPDLRQFLPRNQAESLDLILCWDLPNYLNLGTFAELCGLFAERAAPGCQLHMFISYSRKEMPGLPGQYSIAADGQITQTLTDTTLVQAPRYSPEALGKAVGGFVYERGVLLSNGSQEFVYAWPR